MEQIATQCVPETPRYPLSEQIEVAGETYYAKGIKAVFADAGMSITPRGVTLEQIDCVLVPNPWNEHDPNAVAVCIYGHQVGHLPAEVAIEYAPALVKLAAREIVASGEARVWAKSDGGVVRARVTVLIPEPNRF